MPIYKATFFFEGFQEATVGVGSSVGWTESWYKKSDVGIEAIVEDVGLQLYRKYRLAILAPEYRMSFTRVSDTTIAHNFKLTNTGGKGLAETTTSSSSQVQCGILMDLEKVPSGVLGDRMHHRRFILRGLPSDVINGNVIRTSVKNYGKYNEFAQLVGHKPSGGVHNKDIEEWDWGIRWDTSAVGGIPVTRIFVVPDAFGKTLVFAPALGAPVLGELIQIKGVPAPGKEINRYWRVAGNVVIDGTTYTKLIGTRQPVDVDYNNTARVSIRRPVWDAGPVTQYATIGLRSKKTGRAFRQLRGRR